MTFITVTVPAAGSAVTVTQFTTPAFTTVFVQVAETPISTTAAGGSSLGSNAQTLGDTPVWAIAITALILSGLLTMRAIYVWYTARFERGAGESRPLSTYFQVTKPVVKRDVGRPLQRHDSLFLTGVGPRV